MKKILLFSALVATMLAAGAKAPTEFEQVNNPNSIFEQQANLDEVQATVSEEIITRGPVIEGDTTVFYYNKSSLYWFMTVDGTWYSNNYIRQFVPAFLDVTFTNKSVGVSNFGWAAAKIALSGDTSTVYSKEKDLVMNYEALKTPDVPILTADGVTYNPADFTLKTSDKIYAGGNTSSYGMSSKKRAFFLSPMDLSQMATGTTGSITSGRFTDVKADSTKTWGLSTTYSKAVYPDATTSFLLGVGQKIPAQVQEYCLDSISFYATVDISVAAEALVPCAIYAFDSANPNADKKMIGKATLSPTAAVVGTASAAKSVTFFGEVYGIDELTGLVSEGLIVPANQEILIVVDICEDLPSFFPLYRFYPVDVAKYYDNNLYMHLATDKGNCYAPAAMWSKSVGWGYAYNTNMGIYITMAYIHSYDGNEINLPLEGGNATVSMRTYNTYVNWYVEETDTEVGDAATGTIDNWLKYEIAVPEGKTNFYPNITFSAAKATAPRTATMTIEGLYGDVCQFTVNQGGNGGVENVEVATVSVKAVGGNFEVIAPVGVNSVAVYNVAGQLVASQAVNAGANTIDGSALAGGVYVLKFNNGYTVKAVK